MNEQQATQEDAEATTITDGAKIPSEWLEALAVRVKLRRAEWRVVAIVLCSSSPISASTVAKALL
jgi:hypothetical protein